MIEIEQTAPEGWVGRIEAGPHGRGVSVRASSFAAIVAAVARVYSELVPLPRPPAHEEAAPAPAAASESAQATLAAPQAISEPRPTTVARPRRPAKAAALAVKE